jgi:quercetin 2,3-dioxygenase
MVHWPMRIDVRPAASRGVTRTEQVVSRHSFSYGRYYDPADVSFGVLLAHNDDELAPGGGFGDHPHRGVEIITWVVTGALRHVDSLGSQEVVGPGRVQRFSTGTGVRHSEVNAATGPTRYLQMWIAAAHEEAPDYAVAQAPPGDGEFVPIVAGTPSRPAPLSLRQPAATLLAARLDAGRSAALPKARFAHVFVVLGSAEVTGAVHGSLDAGDAARITGARDLSVRALARCDVLVWAMDGEVWRPADD